MILKKKKEDILKKRTFNKNRTLLKKCNIKKKIKQNYSESLQEYIRKIDKYFGVKKERNRKLHVKERSFWQ